MALMPGTTCFASMASNLGKVESSSKGLLRGEAPSSEATTAGTATEAMVQKSDEKNLPKDANWLKEDTIGLQRRWLLGQDKLGCPLERNAHTGGREVARQKARVGLAAADVRVDRRNVVKGMMVVIEDGAEVDADKYFAAIASAQNFFGPNALFLGCFGQEK
ncbi:hypothetical protein L7F22_054553 [Adiantum nelumboides]|nr:hypothetical protein [Adiantum nelumboides]